MKKLIVGGLSGMGLALATCVGVGLHALKRDRKGLMAKLDAFAKDKKFVAILVTASPEDAKKLGERKELNTEELAKLVARLEFIKEHEKAFKPANISPKKQNKKPAEKKKTDGKNPATKKQDKKKTAEATETK